VLCTFVLSYLCILTCITNIIIYKHLKPLALAMRNSTERKLSSRYGADGSLFLSGINSSIHYKQVYYSPGKSAYSCWWLLMHARIFVHSWSKHTENILSFCWYDVNNVTHPLDHKTIPISHSTLCILIWCK